MIPQEPVPFSFSFFPATHPYLGCIFCSWPGHINCRSQALPTSILKALSCLQLFLISVLITLLLEFLPRHSSKTLLKLSIWRLTSWLSGLPEAGSVWGFAISSQRGWFHCCAAFLKQVGDGGGSMVSVNAGISSGEWVLCLLSTNGANEMT